MKHLASSVAIAAALVISAPAWAQTNPNSGNPMVMPGGAAPMPPANSAMPPSQHQVHHAVRHAHAMHAHHKGMAARAALTGDTTAQLNREELARIQSGAPAGPPGGAGGMGPGPAPMSAAPMPPPENMSGGNALGTPGPNPGGPGLTPYTGGGAPPPR